MTPGMFNMEGVPQELVRLETMLDFGGIGLQRFTVVPVSSACMQLLGYCGWWGVLGINKIVCCLVCV
jgi:hypothetical protein